MNHDTEHNASTDRSENSRMKISMQRGIEAWFDVDDITIRIGSGASVGFRCRGGVRDDGQRSGHALVYTSI